MANEIITSVQNQKIKDAVLLRDRKHREKSKRILVEGRVEVARALSAGVQVESVFVCFDYYSADDFKQLCATGAIGEKQIFETDKKVFSKLAYGDRVEGIIAICQAPESTFDKLAIKENPLFVVLDGIEKPGNLGAILRTADASAVDAVIVSEGCVDVFNPNVIRASLGTVFTVPVVTCSHKDAMAFLQNQNIDVCSTVPDAETAYFDADFIQPVALIFGAEHQGISSFWRQASGSRVRIPMLGVVDSLNVSTSAAIVLYEVLRQRQAVS